MGNRRSARELTLQFLYQYDTLVESSNKVNLKELQDLFWSSKDIKLNAEIKDFSMLLSTGACENIREIDRIISRYSHHWRLSRMSKVDRNILRLAVYELGYLSNIPAAVTINEAIELAKKYGIEDSPSFINGILDRIRIAHDEQEL